jgi:uncharacterized protein YabE (DUF348 family)
MMPGKTILARSRIPATALIAAAAIILTVAALAACASPQVATIFIVADGAQQTLTTSAATVNQAINEAGISLGP